MRVITGAVSHETNVFSNIKTDLEETLSAGKKRNGAHG